VQPVNNLGGYAIFSMFKPFVQSWGDFSLLQTAVTKSPSTASMQTVEAGGIQYSDQNAELHLFTFFTVNDYTACGDNLSEWNPDVVGWFQYHST